MFEPVHGSAPDIAGEGISNPVGAIASAALMLDHFGLHAEARRVEAAIETATASGVLTRDIGGTSNTDEVTDAIIAAVTKALTPA
jgi:tartrate dehydrogenase/decarboxylase/D-malate dehydrogenase